METLVPKSVLRYLWTFKSYYVVWKRIRSSGGAKDYDMFKSYYVVWKRQISNPNHDEVYMFKSYYVVWKLFFPESAFFATPGLNRTM